MRRTGFAWAQRLPCRARRLRLFPSGRRSGRWPRRMVGAALPGVLAVTAATLVMASAWFEVSLAERRRAANLASWLIAFHAADAALDACAQVLLEGPMAASAALSDGGLAPERLSEPDQLREPQRPNEPDRLRELQRSIESDPPSEPAGWRRPGVFDGLAAVRPFAQWPASAQAPSCVIEPWKLAERPGAQAYLVTARGTGVTHATAVWLQLQIAREGDVVERRWRRVASRP